MTPQERREFESLKKLVHSMLRGESLELNKSLERHLNFLSGSFRISDALDVDTAGASSGQPLEFNGTLWVPGTDNV